jgi:hypothetical protein
MRQTTGTRKSPGKKIVKDIKRATRKHYSSEKKIRIVLDGLRGVDSIAELCRPTPKSEAACGRVNPLVVAMRTESRRNSSVYLVATLNRLHSKHCSKETGTKPRQDQIANGSISLWP